MSFSLQIIIILGDVWVVKAEFFFFVCVVSYDI